MIENLKFGLVLSKIKQNQRLTTSHNVSRAQNGIVNSFIMHHPGNSIQILNPKIPSKIPKSFARNFSRAQKRDCHQFENAPLRKFLQDPFEECTEESFNSHNFTFFNPLFH